jgi:hypothetical protein
MPGKTQDECESLGISRSVLAFERCVSVYTIEKLLKNASVKVAFSSANTSICTSRFSGQFCFSTPKIHRKADADRGSADHFTSPGGSKPEAFRKRNRKRGGPKSRAVLDENDNRRVRPASA